MAVRCPRAVPVVLAVAPTLPGGAPFPTTFWLTCPALVSLLHTAESAGEHTSWTRRASSDPGLTEALHAAERAYREARANEGAGVDPCATVGVAGERQALRVKCLHARVAAALAGLPDPVGAAYVRVCTETMESCDGSPCSLAENGSTE